MMKQSKYEIVADPRFHVHYVSFYIVGIQQLGWKLSFKVIEDFPINSNWGKTHGMPFVINGRKKVYIDPGDSDEIDEKAYAWCDVYAKVNLLNKDCTKGKILAIGPSFSVRFKNPIATIILSLTNYIKCRKSLPNKSIIAFVKSYLYTIYRRCSLTYYEKKVEEQEGYVFSMNTLWYDDLTGATTNHFRGLYCKLCKKLMHCFEGGVYYVNGVENEWPQYIKYKTEYNDILTNKRVGMKDYLDKTKKSIFVFNTPAVAGCHGWKLAEYILLGKAIISTPISKVMPGEFLPNKHYVEARNKEEIETAIIQLRDNRELRQQLKENVREYYKKYLSPSSSVRRIFC